MKKVITYGTFDVLHYGHIRLLERAKALGDYLIVGVTSDDYDRIRGKINLRQSLMERMESVKALGIADEIIVEEYEGQKIDDIKRFGVDIFTVGSDWVGKFDYLNEFCEVIYLERTKGISSSKIRSETGAISMGLVGEYASLISKLKKEDKYVNGIEIVGICTNNIDNMSDEVKKLDLVTTDYEELLDNVDSVYIKSDMDKRYDQIKLAIEKGKHILYESPLCDDVHKAKELIEFAKEKKVILMEAIRTAYTTAFSRITLLLKGGRIGNVVSIDATCTSILDPHYKMESFIDWGPTAMLPVFQILGTDYKSAQIISKIDKETKEDIFTQVNFIYENATANIKVAEGAKAEGELVITGTEGYLYVQAPWWKTDYFEIRYEDQTNNRRYFYQLDGEGIRNELVIFLKAIQNEKRNLKYIDEDVTFKIVEMIEKQKNKEDLIII